MANVFMSFSSRDRELVERMVVELEQDLHTCWYFSRDTMAGPDYLTQVAKGIQSCDVFVVLVTEFSLQSHQVSREIEMAHSLRKPMLPILVSLTNDSLLEHRPGWFAAFGATAHLQWPDLGWHAIFSKLRQAVPKLVKVVETSPVIKPPPPREPSKFRKSWASDAQLMDIAQLDEVIYQTSEIEAFLESDGQFFVSANKGFGKTLVLTCKRSRLMAEYARKNDGNAKRSDVMFIPEGRPFLDFIGNELSSLSGNHHRFLAELRNCKRLWSFALRMSVLTHVPTQLAKLDRNSFRSAAEASLDDLFGLQSPPTAVFRAIMSLPVKAINRMLDEYDTKLELAFRGIHQGVFVFIDRLDQGISSLARDAWIHVQAGLIEAAWNVMSINNHVKVFASLREEAYANYESDSKGNLFSATLTLRYSQSELSAIIERLSVLYEHRGFSDFIAMKTIHNLVCGATEDSFQYLLRHTVGRPRDLVIICSELSRYRLELNETKFRDIVNDVGANTIIKNVFAEMATFLDCLKRSAERERSFQLLPANILTRSEVEDICCQFNGIPKSHTATEGFSRDLLHHPFCELYACGLIGIARENDSLSGLQQFKQPYDVTTPCGASLPQADYYLVHPCLHSLIYKKRYGEGYDAFRYVVVGHGYRWPSGLREVLQLQRELFCLADLDIQEAGFNWLDTVLCSESLPENVLNTQPRQAPEELLKRLSENDYTEAWLALDNFCQSRKCSGC